MTRRLTAALLQPRCCRRVLSPPRSRPFRRARSASASTSSSPTAAIPVAGLTAADFELRDNGVVQTIDVVDTSDIPINAVLALDTSASTEGQRQKDLIAASQALLDGLKPIDRAALTTFSHAVAPRIALTSDLSAVEAAAAAHRAGRRDRDHGRRPTWR